MPLPKIEDARKLNDEELAEEILAVKRQLFELRLKKATSNLEKTHQFKHTRHRLAQLLTVEREREIAASHKQAEPAAAAPEAASESEPEAASPESQPEKSEQEQE